MTMIIRGLKSMLLRDDKVMDSFVFDWRWCGVARFESGHSACQAIPDEGHVQLVRIAI
jgi:hypothetical protein